MNTSLNKVCSFFGHSDIEINNSLIIKLTLEIEKLILNNFNIFYFGGFGDFDELCYQIVSSLKEKYTHIKRVHCLSNPQHIRPNKRPRWLNDRKCDEYIYLDLEFDYYYSRIYYRNCEMIKKSDIIIFYVENRENSGAYKALQYAKKKKKPFVNISTFFN